VRERCRQRGFLLPPAEKALPFYPAGSVSALTDRPDPPNLTNNDGSPVDAVSEARLRITLAQCRMAQAWLHLEEAERQGVALHQLAELEEAYRCEVATYAAARAPLSGTSDSP